MTERDEMLALADKIGKQDFNSCDLYCERPYFLIVKALHLAAVPAPGVREALEDVRGEILSAKETFLVIENDGKRYGAMSTTARDRGWQLTDALKKIDGLLAALAAGEGK